MIKSLVSITLLTFSIFTFAQSNIKIDEKAPAINITDWIQNQPKDKDLKGKFIVLEFWATWCGPCIAAVPHMNELQSKVADEKLIFLSITDESVEKISRTLEKIDFKSVVVTDQTQKTQIAFGDGKKGLEAYPMTVLIDDEGLVKWIGEPMQLNSKVVNDFLNKTLKGENYLQENKPQMDEAVKERSISISESFLTVLRDKNTLYFFQLKETESREVSNMKVGDKATLLSSVSLKELYKELFKLRVNVTPNMNSKRYSLLYKNTKPDDQSIRDLRTTVLNTLGLQEQKQLFKTKKNEVSIADSNKLKPALEKMFSSNSEADDKIIFSNFTIAKMLEEMNGVLNTDFYYEENNTGGYDFIVNKDSIENFKASLKSYGLAWQLKEVGEETITLVAEK
ncbi:MAG: TlpA disulfide reductase family protein [Bacteroidota bacterium]